MLLAAEYHQTGTGKLSLPSSRSMEEINSAAEEQRVKLRFAGASCQSEENRSTVAMVTSGRERRAPAACRR